MNLTLEALEVLDTVARKGSFSATIELDRTPSALTYSARKLEEDLDVLLLDRRAIARNRPAPAATPYPY